MRWFGNKGQAVYNADLGHVIRELSPMKASSASEFISLPSADIKTLAEKYVAAMMTEASEDWCRCEWVIHPDDVGKKLGTCRECGTKRNSGLHHTIDTLPEDKELSDKHRFAGIRKRRGEEADDCPVHTRVGIVVYFFEWVFTNAEKG
jgi:hypothetical protein